MGKCSFTHIGVMCTIFRHTNNQAVHFLNFIIQGKYLKSKGRIRENTDLLPDEVSGFPSRAEVLLQDSVA